MRLAIIFIFAFVLCSRATLTNWNSRGNQSVIVCIGDSLTSDETITAPLRTSLQARLGNGGWGYDSASYNGTAHPPNGYSRTGTWTDNITTNGASMSATFSSDTAPATYNITSTVTAFVIHYQVKPGGGTFTYSVDGGTVTSVSTDGASAIAYATNSGLSYASHRLNIQVTNAGTAGVGLCGFVLKAEQAGCRLDNIGRSGSEASFWLTTGDTNLWKNALAELSPTVVTILFGVNECINNRTPASYSNNLASLVGMVRNAAPNSDVILITPPDIGAVTTYPMSAYVTNVAAIAGSMGCGYVDVYSAWGPYGSHPEWYLNSTHPNAAGGAVIAGYVYGLLFSTPTARISSMAMTSVKFQ